MEENIKTIITGSQFLDEFLTIVDSQMHFHKNFVHAASASLQLEGFFLFKYTLGEWIKTKNLVILICILKYWYYP